MSCRAGELTGAGGVRIITRWQEPPGFWGYPYGPGGAIPTGRAGLGGWYGPGYPVSDYPNLNIRMR